MYRALLLACVVAWCGTQANAGSFSGARVQLRPQLNFIVVILDDVGRDNLTPWTPGATAVTPNIEALAAAGATLDTFWVGPTCATTRTELLTGRYAFRTGVYGAVTTTIGGLSSYEWMLPEDLGRGGYASAAFGKAGIQTVTSSVADANAWYRSMPLYGFDSFDGRMVATIASYYDWEHVTATASSHSVTASDTDYITDDTIAAARAWRTAHLAANPTQPYLMWVAFNAAHQIPGPTWQQPPGGSCVSGDPCYYETLEYADTALGLLLGDVTAAQRTNTCLIMLGDNGSPETLGGGKSTSTEAGINVPILFSWACAGASVRGTSIAGLHTGADLFPTLRDFAVLGNAPSVHPTDPDRPTVYFGQTRYEDGLSMRGTLLPGAPASDTHDCIYGAASSSDQVMRCALYPTLKYKRWVSGITVMHSLYEWATDETTDVAGSYPTELAYFTAQMDALITSEPEYVYQPMPTAEELRLALTRYEPGHCQAEWTQWYLEQTEQATP